MPSCWSATEASRETDQGQQKPAAQNDRVASRSAPMTVALSTVASQETGTTSFCYYTNAQNVGEMHQETWDRPSMEGTWGHRVWVEATTLAENHPSIGAPRPLARHRTRNLSTLR